MKENNTDLQDGKHCLQGDVTRRKTAKEKCILKWEKRLEKSKKFQDKYGQYYGDRFTSEIIYIKELIRDLKRF